MATLDDVRTIALALPGVTEGVEGHGGGVAFRTRAGNVVWERGPRAADVRALDALGRTWPDGVVVGVRTDGAPPKEALLQAYPEAFFSTPHFDGYPAVLVRLDTVPLDLLREVVTESWMLRAPRREVSAWIAAHPEAAG